MRTLVNGIEVDVHVAGRESAPVMVVHHGGFGVSSAGELEVAWGPFADIVRVVTYDARGCGGSPLVPPYSHAQWAADVDGIRSALGVDKIVMAGQSFGGMIALEYVLRYPDHVSALILVDTAARDNVGMGVANAVASPRVDVSEELLDRVLHGKCESEEELRRAFSAVLPLFEHAQGGEALGSRENAAVFRLETHNAAFGPDLRQYDVVSQLGEIACPVLVNVGRHDWITPPELSAEIVRGIADAELIVYEDSGHSPQKEEAVRFQAVVRKFLSDRLGLSSNDC